MKNQKTTGNKGFSLVELIVVIAIMAVLVGVLAPTLIKNIEKSKESKDITNLDSVRQAVVTLIAEEKYYSEVVPKSGATTTFSITTTGSDTLTSVTSDFATDFKAIVGDLELTSKAAQGEDITVTVSPAGKVIVKVDCASSYGNSFTIE